MLLLYPFFASEICGVEFLSGQLCQRSGLPHLCFKNQNVVPVAVHKGEQSVHGASVLRILGAALVCERLASCDSQLKLDGSCIEYASKVMHAMAESNFGGQAITGM